ncbi:MAG: RagB/SusD family nutrient uptake outer membrane protein [Saprospiraceae bacterium]
MKKSHTILFGLLLLVSCNDFLDAPQPDGQLPLSGVFKTGDDLASALTGAYDLIQSGDAMGGFIPALPDLMAGNAGGWFEEVATLQMEPTHWVTERLWTQCYKAINQVNAIVQALPDVVASDATLSTEDAARIEGQALFIRGVLYFELVRLYALPYGEEFPDKPGLPLVLKAVLDKDDIGFPARSTVKEVYQQVENDIGQAQTLMPETNLRGRATKYAATAYLARIAFQKRDYENAAALSGEILDSPAFSLTDTPQEFFTNEGSAEEIWVIFGSGANDPIVGGLASFYNDAPTTAHISADMKDTGYKTLLTPQMQENIQNAGFRFVDLRCDPDTLFSGDNLLVLNDTTRCNKYENGWTSGEDDAPAIRLAEIMLMRAEALAITTGVNAESVELLNRIRRRSMRVLDGAGLPVAQSDDLIDFKMAGFANAGDLREAIIRERRVELAFEGNYLHDLMRLKRNVKNGGNIYGFDAPELRLPIPQREIDANPNLEKNP